MELVCSSSFIYKSFQRENLWTWKKDNIHEFIIEFGKKRNFHVLLHKLHVQRIKDNWYPSIFESEKLDEYPCV